MVFRDINHLYVDELTRKQLADIRAARSEVEIPTTAEWGKAMRAARERRGWTQTQLAEIVQGHQADISNLETYLRKQSTLVPSIALALGIPLPAFAVPGDEWLQRWVGVGLQLRSRGDDDAADDLLRLAERLLAGFTRSDDDDKSS